MAITNALAGVAVNDLGEARRYYAKLLGSDGSQPMEELVEWQLLGGGALQVFADKERAGKSSVTLVVDDIDAQIAAARAGGIEVPDPQRDPKVDTVIFNDPDGNQLVFAQQKSDELAGG